MKNKNEKKNNWFINILLVFIIIQPILDIYWLYDDTFKNIFVFTPSTLIRFGVSALMFIYVLYKYKFNNVFKWLVLYGGVVAGYMILHIIFNNNITIQAPSSYKFSVIDELFYFIRMAIPFIIAYIVYIEKINYEQFKKVIKYTTGFIVITIIITNILEWSLASYSTDKVIEGNLFDWFSKESINFIKYASKGWFYSANKISALLAMLLPINIYFLLTEKKLKINFVIVAGQIIAMIMLGTRVAAFGWVVLSLAMIILLFYSHYINKGLELDLKRLISFLAMIAILALVLITSPIIKGRKYVSDYVADEKKQLSKSEMKKIEREINNLKNDKVKAFVYIEKNMEEKFSLNPKFVEELYPYKYDYKFWLNTFLLSPEKRVGNRNLEILITDHIYDKVDDNNKYNFGISYSRFRSGGVYIENDFLVQFYTIGIFGILFLLVPYIALLLFVLIGLIKNYRKNANFLNLTLSMSLCVMLGVAVLSGHVLDELVVTIIAAFIIGYLLKNIQYNNGLKVEQDVNNEK